MYSHIYKNVSSILAEIPAEVSVIAAVKNRKPEEIIAAIDAGITTIGHNYVQEALSTKTKIGDVGQCHLIGHLQSNKVKKAVEIFHLIESVDSLSLATALNYQAKLQEKIMPILIEVNIGREPQKNGVMPEELASFVESLKDLSNVNLQGLMTMGPRLISSSLRPYFTEAKRLFDGLKKLESINADICYLSMGMSDSYNIAIEEGANMIRLGKAIFDRKVN